MRCDSCGKEIENGEYCEECIVAAMPAAGCSRSALNVFATVMGAVVLFLIATYKPPYNSQFYSSGSLSDIKQLALATMEYSQDYNETFPGWVKNPDGRYVHNVWDQQIDPKVKSKDSYTNGDTGIRSYSDPRHERVLTYGLNGLLITPPKTVFDGDADFASASKKNPPAPLSPSSVSNPAGTIIFAELATDNPMPGVYGMRPQPLMAQAKADKPGSLQWTKAHDGWIDISPRAFIEVNRPVENNYTAPYTGYAENGIARTLYGGGGSYAFADGHAKFLRISQTVGIDTVVDGKTVTPKNCWESWNTNNMWVPQ